MGNERRGFIAGIWHWLTHPSATTSVLALLASGIVVGVAGWLIFNEVLHQTGTNEFCGTACHSHAQFIYPGYQKSVHYANPTGVKATCSDCHIPHSFFPKLWTKTKAGTHDVWAEFVRGSISTAEKYAKETPRLEAQVRADMKASDSQACRYCHQFSDATLAAQKNTNAAAAAVHAGVIKPGSGQTCVDCHTGVGHVPPGQNPFLEAPKPAAGAADAGGGAALADTLGCLACHGVDEKKVGPALKDAGATLKGKVDASALATRLEKGEGHPQVGGSAEDLRKVSDWVLSLAGGVAPAAAPAASPGQAAAEKAGCLTCHAVAEKHIGPALKDVAAAWAGTAKQDALIARLRKGEGHPTVDAPEAELKTVAAWLATLK